MLCLLESLFDQPNEQLVTDFAHCWRLVAVHVQRVWELVPDRWRLRFNLQSGIPDSRCIGLPIPPGTFVPWGVSTLFVKMKLAELAGEALSN